MSHVTASEVQRLARLARIGLSDAEIETFGAELGAIVEFVRQLEAVNVDDVTPTDQVTGLTDVMRVDEVVASMTQEQLLANVPETMNGSIKVRRVIGG